MALQAGLQEVAELYSILDRMKVIKVRRGLQTMAAFACRSGKARLSLCSLLAALMLPPLLPLRRPPTP